MTRSFLIGCIALLISATAHAREEVYVGLYPFAPFAYKEGSGVNIQTFAPAGQTHPKSSFKGVSLDLLELLNQHQAQFHFKTYVTTPSYRFKAFTHNKFDMMLFESRQWGWQNLPVVASREFLKGGEVYIALQHDGRDQGFFDTLKGKSIIGIKGYHYGFAKMNSDPEYLQQQHNVRLTDSNESSIKMLLGRRGDIAVVTQSYLNMFLHDNPQLSDKLLVSDRKDQHYLHTILVREDHKITPALINTWLDQLESNGSLKRLWKKWGLDANH